MRKADLTFSGPVADLYRSTLAGQYVVVDKLPNGEYTLGATTDFRDYFAEGNEDDNSVLVGLKINGNKVSVLDEPPYIPPDWMI